MKYVRVLFMIHVTVNGRGNGFDIWGLKFQGINVLSDPESKG